MVASGGRGLRAAQVVCLVGLIGLYLFSAFADVQGRARTGLSVAIAVLTTVFSLLNRPVLRPPEGRGVPRSGFVAFAGRLGIVVVWIVQAGLFGFSGFLVSANFQEEPGFHGRVALIAAVGQVLAFGALCARSMAGFRPDRGFRFTVFGVLRHLVDRVVLVVLAGYAGTLPQVAETAVAWVPEHLHDRVSGLLPGWLAWPVTIAACAVWFVGVLVVESLVQRLIASGLGPDNSLGAWLGDHTPVSYRRTDTDVTFDFDFLLVRLYYYNSTLGWAFLGRVLIEMRYSSSFGPRSRPPTRRRIAKGRRYERPLAEGEMDRLREEIAGAAVAAAPREWRLLLLEYRAAGRYEEAQVRVDPRDRWARGWDPPATEDPEADTDAEPGEESEGEGASGVPVDLPGFAGLPALRRWREASYTAENGVAHVLVVSVEKIDPTAYSYSPEHPWRTASWQEYDAPGWRQPPSVREYRRDLRRFPTARGSRPFWLRNRVKRIG